MNGIQGFSVYKVRLNNGTLSKIIGTHNSKSLDDGDLSDVAYVPQEINTTLSLPSITSSPLPLERCPVINPKNLSVSTLCMLNMPQVPPNECYCQSLTHNSFLAVGENMNVFLSSHLYKAKWGLRCTGLFAYIYSKHVEGGISTSYGQLVVSKEPEKFLFFFYESHWIIVKENKALNVLPDGTIGFQRAVDRSTMFRLIEG
ncbi:hypothetical protein HMI56_005194 [Coelomomyces lativittatus]|nr:hypothetical protein HMI56_005194 [Coelomomyces lativittatus]